VAQLQPQAINPQHTSADAEKHDLSTRMLNVTQKFSNISDTHLDFMLRAN